MGDDKIPLEQQFTNFAKFGDNKADGKAIKLSNIDRWLKQAEILGKKLTMTDTGVSFNKFKVKAITYKQFIKFLEELSMEKKIPLEEMKEKLEWCGLPGVKKKEGAKPAVALPTGSTY